MRRRFSWRNLLRAAGFVAAVALLTLVALVAMILAMLTTGPLERHVREAAPQTQGGPVATDR